MKCLPVFMGIMMLSGCSLNSVPTPDHTGNVDSAVIVVPGYYGTQLVRESDGSLVFITLSQVLFGDQSLTIPVPGLGFQKTIDLQPEGIFEAFRVVPLVYSIDVYGSLLDRLRVSKPRGGEVIPFTYDWRGDLMHAVRSFDGLIRRLRDQGKKDISVVAHSMGGLIVSYYLRYGTQNIDTAVETWEGAGEISRVVMAGVPFLGAMNSFRNMNYGATFGWNSSLLSYEAYASFPASYYLLPIAESDELLTPELKLLHGVIRNAGQWQQSEWGLLKNKQTLSKEVIDGRAAYLSFWLRRSEQFLERLHAPLSTPSPHQPSLLYLYATGTSTLAKGVWTGNPGKGPDSLLFEDPDLVAAGSAGNHPTVYADGDGTVTVSSAWLPAAYRQSFQPTIRDYEVGHTELVTTPDIQDDIIKFLDRR
ncbi:lipase/acyltransferase domain-containing protein [Candidatus Nitrospira neomarina]|uniref:Alpha/beta hydrolase n=1 Tax=Candidatus Nitrospira neomarina TaxID=3020899 RepID=A0AA96JWR4_9BACT|nr:alpha/beta hydrolase [Candidatus Nitrospira neomarina]WNM62325.1 alpha/beta hydrolase [Candidatus Nitrospira neomarina]